MSLENLAGNFQYTLEQSFPGRIDIIGEAAMTKISRVKKPKIQINSILIPEIGVSAPIVRPESENEKDILLSLKEGVALYPSFSMPGEKGTTIILGHSSPHLIYRGKYNTVFSFLGRLEKEDEIIIYYNNDKYIYKVTAKHTFSPTKEIKEQKDKPILLLVTCWPPGTDINRMVVRAELVRD